jgi:hypothetical protein
MKEIIYPNHCYKGGKYDYPIDQVAQSYFDLHLRNDNNRIKVGNG